VGSGVCAAAYATCAATLFATPAHSFAIVIAIFLSENGSPFMAGETESIKCEAIPADGHTGLAALTALAAHSFATCSASSATASISFGDAPASSITVITTVASFIAVDAISAAALVVAAASAISSAVGGCCGSRGGMGGGSVCHDSGMGGGRVGGHGGGINAAGAVSSVVGVNEFAENIVIC
jgi:hypothetical protein